MMHEDQVREFVVSEYERLVRAVALFCGSVDVAEDAVQDALSKAVDRSSEPNDVESVALWVTTVAFNRVRRSFRRRQTEQRLQESLPPAERVAGDGAPCPEALDVRRAVARLPSRQRQVIVLHYFLGYSVATISESLSISDSATKNALHKGRTTLGRDLGPDYARGDIDAR